MFYVQCHLIKHSRAPLTHRMKILVLKLPECIPRGGKHPGWITITGRKRENPRKIHKDSARTCKLDTERAKIAEPSFCKAENGCGDILKKLELSNVFYCSSQIKEQLSNDDQILFILCSKKRACHQKSKNLFQWWYYNSFDDMLTQILTWIYFNEELKSVLKARRGLKENTNTLYFQVLISSNHI